MFYEANDLLANFDPNLNSPNGKPDVFTVLSNKELKYLDTRIISYSYMLASQAGIDHGLVQTDTNNLAPRMGFTWRIGEKNVSRGGWCVYYPTSAAQGIRDPIATNPFNEGVTFRNTASAPFQGWPATARASAIRTKATARSRDITPNPDFGRLIKSFFQEGIDSRRSVRPRIRLTW